MQTYSSAIFKIVEEKKVKYQLVEKVGGRELFQTMYITESKRILSCQHMTTYQADAYSSICFVYGVPWKKEIELDFLEWHIACYTQQFDLSVDSRFVWGSYWFLVDSIVYVFPRTRATTKPVQ